MRGAYGAHLSLLRARERPPHGPRRLAPELRKAESSFLRPLVHFDATGRLRAQNARPFPVGQTTDTSSPARILLASGGAEIPVGTPRTCLASGSAGKA